MPSGSVSTYLNEWDLQQAGDFAQLSCEMSNADSTVVRRPLRVPRFHEPFGANREAVVAVGIADAQHLARDALGVRRKELESVGRILDHRQQRHGSVFHTHLHRQPAPYLAVIY